MAIYSFTYRLPFDFKIWMPKGLLYTITVFKSNKSKTSRASRLSVSHECCVDNFSELHKIISKLLLIHFLRYAANKDFLRLVLFFSRNGAFGINLLETILNDPIQKRKQNIRPYPNVHACRPNDVLD